MRPGQDQGLTVCAGTGSSVIYVPGIGYVTPVNSDGTTASPAAPAKGMAHLPMYGSPATQGSSPATGGVTTQSGGQASAKTGTKKPTGDAGTNAASTQVPASENAAGEAGANGGTNSGTDLSDGSQSSTATGSAAGLSNSQGSGSTSSGSKATGSGASDSAGSESGRYPVSFSCFYKLRSCLQLHPFQGHSHDCEDGTMQLADVLHVSCEEQASQGAWPSTFMRECWMHALSSHVPPKVIDVLLTGRAFKACQWRD